MQPRLGADALAQIGTRPAAREHITQRAVEREVQHARQHRPAVGAGHVGLDLARLGLVARAINAEALAEDMKLLPAGAARHLRDARRPRIA